MRLPKRKHLASTYSDYGGALVDAVVIGVALVVIYLLIGDAEWFEALYDFTRDHEDWELDELIVVFILLSFGLIVFGIRRLLDQRREIRNRRSAENAARRLANADALTGLSNRRQFETKVADLIRHPDHGESRRVAVMMLDLDRFKAVNDVFGHAVGDQVLVAFAARARNILREEDLLARFGGDEFALVLPVAEDSHTPARVARRLIGLFEAPFVAEGIEVRLGTSIGIALASDAAATPQELLRRADIALYRAKREGGGRFSFFEAGMEVEVQRRAQLERDLRQAIRDARVEVHYQPIMHLSSRRLVGFEALARWTHGAFGPIAPEVFIGIAEDGGFVTGLTDYLFAIACRDAATWPAGMTLSFNLARADLRDPGLAGRLLPVLRAAGLSPGQIEVEISEDALVAEVEAAKPVLAELHGAGIRIALDDFGTGNSSLIHIREELVDRIKIDQSFIAAMGVSRGDAAVVRAILGLSRALGLKVTAEGIEDASLVEALVAEGCEDGQGFSFGAAVPAAAAAAMASTPAETWLPPAVARAPAVPQPDRAESA